jgi:hypothetical protein
MNNFIFAFPTIKALGVNFRIVSLVILWQIFMMIYIVLLFSFWIGAPIAAIAFSSGAHYSVPITTSVVVPRTSYIGGQWVTTYSTE